MDGEIVSIGNGDHSNVTDSVFCLVITEESMNCLLLFAFRLDWVTENIAWETLGVPRLLKVHAFSILGMLVKS